MSSDVSMRASDGDRDRATGVLREAYAAGRLTLDEFLQRTDAACSARTWGELAGLTADLPEGKRLVLGGPQAESGYQSIEFHGVPSHLRTPLWVMAFIWLAIAAAAHVFAALPLVMLALFVLRTSRGR